MLSPDYDYGGFELVLEPSSTQLEDTCSLQIVCIIESQLAVVNISVMVGQKATP